MRANESNSGTREGQAEMCEKHLTVPCLTARQLSTEQERPEQNPVREDGDRSPARVFPCALGLGSAH